MPELQFTASLMGVLCMLVRSPQGIYKEAFDNTPVIGISLSEAWQFPTHGLTDRTWQRSHGWVLERAEVVGVQG